MNIWTLVGPWGNISKPVHLAGPPTEVAPGKSIRLAMAYYYSGSFSLLCNVPAFLSGDQGCPQPPASRYALGFWTTWKAFDKNF